MADEVIFLSVSVRPYKPIYPDLSTLIITKIFKFLVCIKSNKFFARIHHKHLNRQSVSTFVRGHICLLCLCTDAPLVDIRKNYSLRDNNFVFRASFLISHLSISFGADSNLISQTKKENQNDKRIKKKLLNIAPFLHHRKKMLQILSLNIRLWITILF